MSTAKPLFIPLRAEHFDAFDSGTKGTEYRPYGPRWNERTCSPGRRVVLSRGYGTKRRLDGFVVGFERSAEATSTEDWRSCYGDRDGDAACIHVVTLKSSWATLLGPRGTSPAYKRTRWAAWLRLARHEDMELAAMWARDLEQCDGCAERRGGWCGLMGLPCTVNPILTVRHGMIGMACMGAGFKPRQLTANTRAYPELTA